jgi:hypothetical protein
MSAETTQGRARNLTIVAWIVGGVGSLVVLLILTLGRNVAPPPQAQRRSTDPSENPLAAARSALGQRTDLATCGEALQQINAHLAKSEVSEVPALSKGEAAKLQERFGLNKGELEEVRSTTFTTLDASHLDVCFLLRDAARSLDPRQEGDEGPAASELERVTAAFDWVMRQVRLDTRPAEDVPPAYILRRGSGSAVERALVFLALLEQVGLPPGKAPQGCVVLYGNKDQPHLWACGVALSGEPDKLYLFDPRLGLPLPGAKGKGVATLAEVRADPAILRQLDAGEKLRYDIGPEQVKTAWVGLVCSLSALAPRMRVLQDTLLRERQWQKETLPEPVVVRLAQDGEGALKRLRDAAGKGVEVGVVRPVTGLLRRFLAKDKGGVDPGKEVAPQAAGTRGNRFPREALFRATLVPWQHFPARLKTWGALDRQLREAFAGAFIRLKMDSGAPHDLVLRGRFSTATPLLGKELKNWQDAQAALETNQEELAQALKEWHDRALTAYAKLHRARGNRAAQEVAQSQVASLWKRGEPIHLVLGGSLARPMLADVDYLLGLCKQEQAERMQARLDREVRAGHPPSPSAVEEVRDVWKDARGWWEEYSRADRTHPGVVSARRLHGQAEAALGNTAEALRLWRDLSKPMTDPEKLANLYLARQLEKKKK